MRGNRWQVVLKIIFITWLMQQRVFCLIRRHEAHTNPIFRMSSNLNGKLFPSVQDWAQATADNSFLQRLVEESTPGGMSQFDTRQVHRAHFVRVQPENVPNPSLVIASESCATSIGLSPEAVSSQAFTDLFVGNQLPQGLNSPWASVYGCHCHGQWFGQLGDGRAMSIGEVALPIFTGSINDNGNDDGIAREERIELQLKGCGRTPFSR